MNELIKVTYDSECPTISGRDLHEALEVKTPYTQWFERMKEYGFAENTDFALVSQKCETNNPKNPYTTITDHQLTIDMAKEICMLQRSEKGKQFRQYFIEIEKQWNTPEAVMARALQMANRQIEEIKSHNIRLEAKIEEDKPKVLFAEAVAASKTSILIGELAKLLKQNGVEIGQNRLFEWMRGNGYLISRKGSDYNMPMQRYMEMRLFEIKESTSVNGGGSIKTNKTPKVTGKGQAYFINKFLGQATDKHSTE